MGKKVKLPIFKKISVRIKVLIKFLYPRGESSTLLCVGLYPAHF